MWHGNKSDRGYIERWKIIEDLLFDPDNDLKKNS